MNEYELKNQLNMINIVIQLLAGHTAELYAREPLNYAIRSKRLIEKELKDMQKRTSTE